MDIGVEKGEMCEEGRKWKKEVDCGIPENEKEMLLRWCVSVCCVVQLVMILVAGWVYSALQSHRMRYVRRSIRGQAKRGRMKWSKGALWRQIWS